MKKISTMAATLAMAALTASPAVAESSAAGGDVQIQYQNAPQSITQSANANQSNTGGGTGAAVSQNLGVEQNAANVAAQAGDDINVDGSGNGGFHDNGEYGNSSDGFDDGANASGGDVQIQNQNAPQTIDQNANANQSNTGGGTGAAVSQNLGVEQNAANVAAQAGGDINVDGNGDGVENDAVEDDAIEHDVKDDGEAGVENDVEEDANANVAAVEGHSDDDDHGISSGQVASAQATHEGAVAVEDDAEAVAYESDDGAVADSAVASQTSTPAAASGGVLPDTGGASVLLIGGGILLVGGGLLARRVFG